MPDAQAARNDFSRKSSKYPPAEPGALFLEPLKAAGGVADAAPFYGATYRWLLRPRLLRTIVSRPLAVDLDHERDGFGAALRQLRFADFKAVRRLIADDEVRTALGLPERAGLLDAIALSSERVNEHNEREAKWAVVIEEQFGGRWWERVVGICGLAETEACEGEIWYALEAHARGVGLMTAAVRTMVARGFEDFALTAVVARVSMGNFKSRALLARLGFTTRGGDYFALTRDAFVDSISCLTGGCNTALLSSNMPAIYNGEETQH
jgi:RimJ/RimL family protein N-acetyltransferase